MEDGTIQFRGVRYATSKRWAYASPVDTWHGEYDATKFGNACIQLRTFDSESKKKPEPFYYKEFRKDVDFNYSEDCLFLDIYAPENTINAPVIVHIHGGAFLGGCSNEKHMDGTAYAKRGVIFVSINYRLGVLGFLCDRKLTEEAGHSGNYGLYDQLEAIRWVHRYISEFGGNPNNIMLFGQSAGAMSIQQHCLSPLTKPYISKVYMASGGGVGDEFAAVNSVEDSYDYWSRLTNELGDSPKAWREAPIEKVFDVFRKIMDDKLMEYCCPHIAGKLIAKDPKIVVKEKNYAKVPYLLSSNSEDMLSKVLEKMSKDWCRLINKNGGKAYYFYFKRQLPGDDKGAFHSAELWYTIGALDKCWRPMTDLDRRISEGMLDSIANFAKTGNPNCEKIHDWKPFDKESDAKIIDEKFDL